MTAHQIQASRTTESLKEAGRILLVSCYELGHQPLGIALPLGFLESAGYRPAALDIAVEEFDSERIHQARLVGISVPMHTALRLGVQVAEQVHRMNPRCAICFFGLYASINAEYLLERVADFVIGGEYEHAMLQLVEALDECRQNGDGADAANDENDQGRFVEERGTRSPAPSKTELSEGRLVEERGRARHRLSKEGRVVRRLAGPDIQGVSRRGRVVGPILEKLWNRDSSGTGPGPSRAALPPLERYAVLEHNEQRHLVGYIEASRGCLHRCRHCPIVPVYDGRFFLVPEAIVLEDIRTQVSAGARHITFGDADFLNGPGHSLSIVRAMHREFPGLTFDFTAKIEHLLKRRTLFRELADSNCLFVISAVESFSDLVLTHLVKGHTREDIFTALEILREVGITLRPSLVAFTPWTTLEDYLEMFELVEAHNLIDAIDPVQYSVRLLIPPGSALLTETSGQPAVQRFLGPLDQARFQYPWSHPDPQMDELHQDITGVVQQAVQDGENTVVTFERLWQSAASLAGRPWPGRQTVKRPPAGPKTPRMTEPWFCCSEPMPTQLAVVKFES